MWKQPGKLVCAGVEVAEEVFETLDKLIGEENYLLEQVFNMNKNLPVHIHI